MGSTLHYILCNKQSPRRSPGLSDVTRWTIFSLLDPDFIDNIRLALVFGSTASEALIVTSDDKVYGIGSNASSCLGLNGRNGLRSLGNGHSSLEPILVDSLCGRGVAHLVYGNGKGPHILALTEQGEVFAWGNNSCCQLGYGNGSIGITPAPVTANLSNYRVVQVACGYFHSMALTADGEVLSWGANSCGQVGAGNNANQPTPRKVGAAIANKCIRSIACSQTSSFAVSDCGEVFSWGENTNGQLGNGDNVNQLSPVKVDALDDVVVLKVVCGYAHSLAVTDEGALYAWGSNSCGQLGTGSRADQLSPIQTAIHLGRICEAAAAHSCNISAVLTQTSKVYMWGQCRGQTVCEPQETRFTCVDDVFACFASPPVSFRQLTFAPISQHSIQESVRSAFDDPGTADVTFHVEHKPIYVHRAILKIRCQHFRSMFQDGTWIEGQKQDIDISQFPYAVYRGFLSYLYSDRVDLPPEEAVGLMDLANSYCEAELKQKCADIIRSGITVDNAVMLYAAALKYDSQDLEEFCFRFCLNHLTAVAQTEAFQKLDEATIKHLMVQAARCGAFKY